MARLLHFPDKRNSYLEYEFRLKHGREMLAYAVEVHNSTGISIQDVMENLFEHRSPKVGS